MKRLVLLAALVVALAAGWWFGSPWWTLRQMRAAADTRNIAALSEHVDYPALRESVKAQLRERTADEAAARDLGPLGALIASGIAEPLVDALVTPEGMGLVFAAVPAADRGEPALGVRASEMAMRRDSPAQFRMVATDGSGAELVFRLRGIGWKLVAVRLPRETRS